MKTKQTLGNLESALEDVQSLSPSQDWMEPSVLCLGALACITNYTGKLAVYWNAKTGADLGTVSYYPVMDAHLNLSSPCPRKGSFAKHTGYGFRKKAIGFDNKIKINMRGNLKCKI